MLNQDYLQIGNDIIGASFEVRKNVGSGMRESYYQSCVTWELRQMGYDVQEHVLIPCLYKGQVINDAYEADAIVDNRVVLEFKALGQIMEAEMRQLLTYLRLTQFKLGYILNFGVKDFRTGSLKREEKPYRSGIYRIANNI